MGSDDQASGFQPKPSARRQGRQSASAQNDDDYDLHATAVSDGFRPTRPSSTPLPSQPLPPSKGTPDADRPSSTCKHPQARDPLALRNDGSDSASRRQPDAPVLPRVSTGSPLIHLDSPYRGPSEPSYRYPMYLQRTFSNATASTAPCSSRQPYDGPRGPAHPYSLYTQNTAAAEETAQQHIPVGFMDMGSTYQRQIGPDGEEAGDLVGPLGHLEELPPYTRYPEEPYAGRKSPDAAPDLPSSPAQPIPGAGGLGIATRDPEFSSTEDDLALSQSRPASQSQTSQHEVNTAAREVSEKPTMNRWQQRARKKIWGVVPCWAICLLVVGIAILGIVMGSVIGTVVANHGTNSSPQGDGQFDRLPNAPVDVKPLSSLPPDLPRLSTGLFSLPPLDTSQSPKSCFSDPTQSQAWSCNMPFRFYSMAIGHIPDAPQTSNYELALSAFNRPYAKLLWGTQPPDIPDPQPLFLVTDSFEEVRGPAWWLKITYNKTVIVPEGSFPPKMSKRGVNHLDGPVGEGEISKFRKKKMGAKDGDMPWICTWPDTMLEIFIYPGQNASMHVPPAAPPTEASTTSADYVSPTPAVSPMPKYYPNVVKFLERHWYEDPKTTARCRQVRIIDNGRGKEDLRDKDGNPIEVDIKEKWRAAQDHPAQKRWSSVPLEPREALELTDCGCLWWST